MIRQLQIGLGVALLVLLLSACSSKSSGTGTAHDAGADAAHADGAADSAVHDSATPVDSTTPPQDSSADTTIPSVDSSTPDTSPPPDSSFDVTVDSSEDTSVPDTSPPEDTGIPSMDSSPPEDSSVADTSPEDTGILDTGTVDTGTLADSAPEDTGMPMDSAIADTGTVDTGTLDTGTLDTGTLDTGTVDTGTVDTGGPTFTVGGTISGLAGGDSVRLLDNGGDAVFVSSNTSFTFPTALSSGATYAVTIGNQPALPVSQTCTVANGMGTVASSNITDVTVTCVPNFSIGGTLAGLHNGDSVTVRDNGGNPLTLTGNGPFTFTTELPAGATYDVTTTSPLDPVTQSCTVTGGTGTVTSTVNNVSVNCVP